MTEANNAAVAAPMGQCAITGKTVPEDELVTLHGYRVCAEGKAILLDRLKSGEMLPGQMEAPSVLRRFGCLFVDGLVLFLPAAFIGFMVGIASGGSALATGALAVLLNALEIVYFGQMHASRGQTVGKMAGKIKVVNLDGSPVSTNTAYMRALYYLGPSLVGSILAMTHNPIMAAVGSLLSGVWFICEVVLALSDRQQQRSLHDRLAGTRVIEIQ